MNFSVPMFWLGLFVMGIGAGTTDSNMGRYSLLFGATFGVIGLMLMFFAAKEMRNPKRLCRWVCSIWGYLSW